MSHQGKDDPHDKSSPDSDTNSRGGGGNAPRKRPSRAGTRSVSTLSAAQLERKRANDREAQRAIRQRTKEHIEKLERTIAELTSNDEPNDQLVAALKRNKELEEENALLRLKLEQANYSISMSEGGCSTWDDTVVSRPPPPSQGLQIIPQQHSTPLIQSARTSSPRPNPFSMQHATQWQPANPFGSNSSVKSEATSAHSGDVPPEEYSNWTVDRRRYGSGSGPPGLHQSAYPHVYSASGQPAAPRTSSPLSYHAMQESHSQAIQQSHGGQVLSSTVPMAEYGAHSTSQQYLQHPHQQQQQHQHHQPLPPPPQPQPQYREQGGAPIPPAHHEHQQQHAYYGSYSQG